jgi:hypothetical protein
MNHPSRQPSSSPRRAVADPPPIPVERRLAYGLFTALAGVALLAGSAEALARGCFGSPDATLPPMGRPVQALAEPHAAFGWFNRPDVRTTVHGPGFEYAVQHNSRGLRGPERALAKPEGVQRVLVLGDSLAWGWGVDDGQGFVDLVDEALGPQVELINGGVPGFSTDQQLWFLESEGLAYEPDLVLLCFVLNDVTGNGGMGGGALGQAKPCYRRGETGDWVLESLPAPAAESPPAPAEGSGPQLPSAESSPSPSSLGWARWLRRHSALLQALDPPDAELELAARGERLLGAEEPRREERSLSEHEVETALAAQDRVLRQLARQLTEPEAVTHYLLGRLSERCRAAGVPLLAFSLPHHHDRYLYASEFPRPRGVEAHLVPGAPPYETFLSQCLRRAGARLGFEVFAVDQELLEQTDRGHDLNVGDGHLNALGHRIVAQRVGAELAERLRGR